MTKPRGTAEPADGRGRLTAAAGAFEERLRGEFIKGAEADSQRRLGRPLTREELKRVLRRFPVG